MFEKEAEDKAFKKYPFPTNWGPIDLERNTKYEEGFKDGAEFGYNKANEWHFVKDKLPPMDEVVYLWHGNERFPVCAYRHIPYGKTEKDWLWECYWGSGYTVTQSVAKDYWWKEIVLPKEIEK